jgi:hypothetical protein
MAILFGILLTLIALQLSANVQDRLSCLYTLALALQTIGIALFGFGLFSIIVNSRNWSEYFSNRLRDVVIEQSYLNDLDVDTLKSLQVKVLKAFFRDPNIDKEGSFLNYFQTNLHKYISEPYREDVKAEIDLRAEEDTGLKIFDRVTYNCREAGGILQNEVVWQADPNEFLSIESLKIEVKYPYTHEKKGDIDTLYDKKDLSSENPSDFRVAVSLEPYKNIDGLTVIMEAIYIVDKDRFQYWQMSHPTKNFDLLISFPDQYSIQVKPLVLHPELIQIGIEERYAKITYASWMLPQSGVAWRFIKKKSEYVEEGK